MKRTVLGGNDGWTPSKYLNIWICDLVNSQGGGTTLGYAYLPGLPSWTAWKDGLVVDFQHFGTVGNASSSSDGRTPTHEIGHYLGLYHTFCESSGGGCCDNDNTWGSNVYDTPATDDVYYGNVNANTNNNFKKTIFLIVRFGNVIGSRGSVYQIFLDQIRKNQSLTVTDPRMTRFIMSIQDAAGLILKATKISKGGEIFILKMPSVKIRDLAENMVKVCQTSNKDFKIKLSKSRDHERFHEYLVTPEEIPFCHDLGDMYKISKEKSRKKLSSKEFSSETAKKMNEVKLKNVIKELREEYLPF